MKRIIFFLIILFISVQKTDACVGRVLFIGTLNSTPEKLLSEMLSVVINERTGTTVNIKYYDSPGELFDAAKRDEVGILVENTDHAMGILGNEAKASGETSYSILKEEFRKKLGLVWLEPFGYITVDKSKSRYYYGPIVTEDVLVNFPALPRVINKLSGVINDKAFSKLIMSLESGGKPREIARDFLKAKKII